MKPDTADDVVDIVFDGDEKIEIACSYPDIETAIEALHESAD